MKNTKDYINNFYDKPRDIDNKDYKQIIKLLDEYKREIVEGERVLLVGNDTVYKLFILFLYYYDHIISKESKEDNTKKFHVGIDFEFNMGKVALMQLNFGKYLWVLDPNYYENDKKEIINQKLYWNDKVYKVLHGADSLDLPYLFSDMFDNDKESSMKFMRKYIDTRFLCEYVRNSKNEEGRCAIYNAMLYMGTISQEKYDELSKNSETMGPIQDVMWDIKKLSSFHIKYAFYDVLHLLDFMTDIYNKIQKETPEYSRCYYYIIELIRFAIVERKNVTDVLEFTKEIVNPMNNYYIESKATMIDIYNKFSTDLKINDTYDKKNGMIDFNFLESVNYIKGILSFLLKYVVYSVVKKKNKVYKNKKDIMKEQVSLEELYKRLEDIKMFKIVKLLKLFETEANIKLIF